MKKLVLWRLRWRLFVIRLRMIMGVEVDPIQFVGSSEALPPPLSEEEEHFLLDRLRQGDLSVKTVLIERNLRLVVYIARKFENTGLLIEDQIGRASWRGRV